MVPFPFRAGSLPAALPLLLIGSLLVAGCSGPSGGISGHIKGAEDAPVRISSLGPRGFVDIDTVQADGAGHFSIPAVALGGLALDVYKVNVGEGHFFVIADSLSSLQVEGQLPEKAGLITDMEVQGDVWTSGFTEFIAAVVLRQDTMMSAKIEASQGQTPEAQIEGKRRYDELQERQANYIRKTVRSHKTDPIGLMALEHLNLVADRPLAQQVIDSTRTLMGHSMAHRNLSQRVAKQRKPQQSARRNDLIKPGMPMPDIELEDPNGKTRALSDLRGKVVLVDFWASWCGPCRRENPNVVRAWKEYKDQGFEVFSVSLDKDVKKWQRAIDQDGLIWSNHISDLRGWSSVATQRYGISSIPHAILIDKDGTVVATHLRGAQLETELQRLL